MKDIGKRNFHNFIWHAVFLSLTLNFVDLNTVVPNLILESGGTSIHLGIFTAIMVGGTKVMQLFFAGFLIGKPRKKKFLITGILFRISALLVLGIILIRSGGERSSLDSGPFLILLIMAVFSFSGSFANIAYTDILGKAFPAEKRKRFFIIKQTLSSFGVIISALIVRLVLGLMPYPASYALLFLAAGILLLTGSFGFWRIKEPESSSNKSGSPVKKLTVFREALAKDRNLRLYLLIINTSGITLAVIPFLIGLASSRFGIEGKTLGNYLLIQMAGSLTANLIFNFINKNQRYREILYYFIIAGAAVPILALVLSFSESLYPLVFLLSGSALAANMIATPGILLEISNEENRAVYSGISGAGSIAVLLYPLAAGFLINWLGYYFVFIMSSIIILTGMFFAKKIICSRIS